MLLSSNMVNVFTLVPRDQRASSVPAQRHGEIVTSHTNSSFPWPVYMPQCTSERNRSPPCALSSA